MTRQHLPLVATIVALGATPTAAPPCPAQAPSGFPAALTAATRTLEFHVSQPATGTLDAQVTAALQQLIQQSRGGTFIKLRLFAVGPTALDSARVAVTREFAAAHVSFPVLALVGVAGFPDTAQKVEVEATVAGGGASNPDGVGFIAGVASATGDRAIGGLARVAREAGIPGGNVLRISCFYQQADQVAAARSAVTTTFPAAEASFVLSYASNTRPAVECEAIARLATRPADAVTTFNLAGGTPSPNYSHATLVATPTIIFAGSQVASDASTPGLHDMFERVRSAVVSAGGSLTNVVMGDNYWLTDASRDTLRVVRAQYFGATVPAATGVFFTSLPGGGAAAIELVVAVQPASRDSLTLLPGDDAMDGRYLKPHRAEVTRTVMRAGVIELKDHYTLDKTVTEDHGKASFRLVVDALADAPNPSLHIAISLDYRTMAFLHREEHDGNGREGEFTMSNTHVVGTIRPARDSAMVRVDFALAQPAFLASFLDAAVNATDLSEGLILRIPTFGLAASQQSLTWHRLRVVGRDTVRIGNHVANAWVVEEGPVPAFRSRRIWLLREPPYFPLDVTVLPDGAVQRIEQHLVPEITVARDTA